MEPDSSASKGKGRAQEHAHLPAWSLSHTQQHAEDDEIQLQQSNADAFDDTPACLPSPRPSDRDLELEGSNFGLFDRPRWPPSPHTSTRELEDEATFGLSDETPVRPPSPRPSNRHLQLNEEIVGVFDDLPANAPSPSASWTKIGEGNLDFVDIEGEYTQHVEHFAVAEGYRIPLQYIDIWYANVAVSPFTIYGKFTTRVVDVQGSPVSDVLLQHPNLTNLLREAFLCHSPHFILNVLERHGGQWVWFWDNKYVNYGQKRKSWVVAVLHPVYQAAIDLRFRLLARAVFAYSPSGISTDRASQGESEETDLIHEVPLRNLRQTRQRKRVNQPKAPNA